MKIGLIAMSGVRAANPELTAIGLTLPGFVERSEVIASLPSLSLLTLAALTPPDIEVEYREIRDLAAEPEAPRDYDLVAIASYSAQILDAYRVARLYRARGVPVVMGGLHVTALPDEAREAGATAVVGEGELSWPRVIADARARRLAPEYRPPAGCGSTSPTRRCRATSCSMSRATTASRSRPRAAARGVATSAPARFFLLQNTGSSR